MKLWWQFNKEDFFFFTSLSAFIPPGVNVCYFPPVLIFYNTSTFPRCQGPHIHNPDIAKYICISVILCFTLFSAAHPLTRCLLSTLTSQLASAPVNHTPTCKSHLDIFLSVMTRMKPICFQTLRLTSKIEKIKCKLNNMGEKWTFL